MIDKEIRIVQKYSDEIIKLIKDARVHNLTENEAVGIAEAIIINVIEEIKNEDKNV